MITNNKPENSNIMKEHTPKSYKTLVLFEDCIPKDIIVAVPYLETEMVEGVMKRIFDTIKPYRIKHFEEVEGKNYEEELSRFLSMLSPDDDGVPPDNLNLNRPVTVILSNYRYCKT